MFFDLFIFNITYFIIDVYFYIKKIKIKKKNFKNKLRDLRM